MKLAVLGTDWDVRDLVQVALDAGHSVAWLGDVRPDDAEVIRQLLPDLAPSAAWESLLDHGLVDAVIVGRGTSADDLKAEQLKRLVADAVPTLIVHPALLSVLTFYELDMTRRESRAVVRQYNPLVATPNVDTLAQWLETGRSELGTVHQVVCERFAPDCSHDAILRHLARDVELLRDVAGLIRSVNAIGPSSESASYASLQVQLATRGNATSRWSVVPIPGQSSRVELTIIGEHGTATLRPPADAGPIAASLPPPASELEVRISNRGASQIGQPWDSDRAAIDQLAATIAANGTERSAAASTWRDATVAMEVVDAIELSLQKGRTIEIYPQLLTEQLAFRGVMSAFGCGLLFVMLFVVLVAGVLGDALNIPLIRFWPWALLLVLAIFLLLQVVPWLAGKSRATSADSPERAADSEPPVG
jgi:predicted dehydrogenase